MNRLPSKFEVEVLSKHGIQWSKSHQGVDGYFVNDTRYVNKYEIAGIAIEAIMNQHHDGGDSSLYKRQYNDGWVWVLDWGNPTKVEDIFEDSDYCTCVFKAVDTIWK